MVVVIFTLSGSIAGLAMLWAGRSRLGGYEGRHRR
jgi:hypothetical protein